MQTIRPFTHQRRREFLTFGAGALAFALTANGKPDSKPLRGLFPIGQTPFTPDDKLDLDCLAQEVKFCNRGHVHGFVWPQIASQWTTLSEKERFDGAEAILTAGKGGSTALVIGVQAPTLDTALKYAKHAEKNGADAIISLPPPKASADQDYLDYYKQVGAATGLPLFVQSQGDMSIDLILEMFKTIPNMRVVKDEAGNPLQRVAQLRERSAEKLAVFSGNGVRTMITEMELGFSGHCPTTGLSDVYAAAFDLWHAGKKREAFDMFGRVLAFDSIPNSGSYVLVARGVFKESTKARPNAMMGGGGVAGRPRQPLDEAGKKAIREALDTYLKPWLRG
jgi:dihydrodipicolinate synthase/N-acetylneuraminate lyase